MNTLHLRSGLKPLHKLLCLLQLVVVFFLIPLHTSAQWDPNGVLVSGHSIHSRFYICPDNEGGVWFALDHAVGPFDSIHVYLQHIDSDGNRSFGDDGFRLLDERDTGLRGIHTGLNGDCVVLFNRYDGDDFRIFAQRVTRSGDRLWGPVGVSVSTQPSSFQSGGGIFPDFTYTVSDGSGGLWGGWTHLGWNDPYICGVNADGSLKLPDGDLLIGEASSDLPYRLAPDGNGGVAVIFGQNPDWPYTNVRHIYAQVIQADGSLLLPEPLLVMDYEIFPSSGYNDPIYLLYDGNSGFRITTSAFWQRLDSDLNPLWDLQGNRVYDWEPLFQVNSKSRSVVLSDQSTVQVVSDVAYHSQLRLERLVEDGSRPLGEDWGPIAGEELFYPANPTWNRAVPNDTTFLSFCRVLTPPDSFLSVQRIGPNGTSLWSTFLPEDSFHDVNPKASSCFLDDESVCVATTNLPADSTYAFKLFLDDGRLANGENSVTESAPMTPTNSTLTRIDQIAPNPFNASTKVKLHISTPGTYELVLVNVLGQIVERRMLTLQAGSQTHELTVPDGQTSGIYFVQLRQQGIAFDTKKLLLLR